ncbi:MAG: hypothetical protein IKK71_06040, partial [Clostridia bacterium]|nr:hypothetical protein [Clostridia bacterium]
MKKLLALFLTLALLLSVLPMALGVSAAEATGTGDYAIYFDSSISNNFWVTQKDSSHLEIGMEEPNLPAGNTYTVEFDVYSLTLGSRVVFGATQATWNTEAAIEGGHQVWKEAPTSVNTWTHYSFNVTTTADWKGVMFYVIDDADGFTGYIDNLTIKDSQGTVVSSFEPTADDISNISNCASIVELSAELVYAKNPDYAIYFDNTGTDSTFWVNALGMEAPNLPAGNTYTVEFDAYALTQGNNFVFTGTQGLFNTSHAIPDGQVWQGAPATLNEWTHYSFNITTEATLGGIYFHTLGDGFKGYMDNLTIKDSNGNVVASFNPTSANISSTSNGASIVALSKELEYAKNPDYAVLVDNSAGTDFNKFYLHEVGMDYSKTYPIGDYTIKFDFYALEIASNKNIVAYFSATGWSGDAFPGANGQKWLEIQEKVGEWQTLSFDITTIAEGQFPNFSIGAGLKGYFDNYQIIDKSTGNTLLDFTPAKADIGKMSQNIHTVVVLPVDVAAAKPCKHVYDNACDATCNLCEEVREGVGHSY